MKAKNQKKKSWGSFAWDLWCIASIVGIWPRFIEPNLIKTTKLNLCLPDLPKNFDGLKIVQFSDLHFSSKTSDFFLKRLEKKIERLQPDIIVFSGDFLCYSILDDEQRLLQFLSSLKARFGCFAILGNHDYEQFVSVNSRGEYDLFEETPSYFLRSFERFINSLSLTKQVTSRAKEVPPHKELINLLKKSPFFILHNENKIIEVKGSYLNICGLGEHMLGRVNPSEAFKDYNDRYPGIVLVHNPDALPVLKNYPGQIILSGHTHGCQVNLPWFRKKFTLMENPKFVKGIIPIENKFAYVNRGISGTMPFRWFAPPEILQLTLESKNEN